MRDKTTADVSVKNKLGADVSIIKDPGCDYHTSRPKKTRHHQTQMLVMHCE